MSADLVLSPENKSFSLVTRKNLKDNQEKKATHIARIEKATGVSGWVFDYEGDCAALEAGLKTGGWADKAGGVLLDSYLKNIAEMLERNCKDEMIKEAVLEALSTKKIIFVLEETKTPGAQHISVKDNKLYVGTHNTTFCNNMSEICNFKMESIL